MSQDEIAVMDGGKCIMQLRGVRPFFSDEFDITKHKRYKELSDFDPKNAFDIEDYVKHLQHRFNHMVGRYNDIYRVQMPNITPHICRHTYCSNMAKSGMSPKTLQYLMGHSDISVTMNAYTHIGFDDAEEELKRMEEFRKA
jgi:integrase